MADQVLERLLYVLDLDLAAFDANVVRATSRLTQLESVARATGVGVGQLQASAVQLGTQTASSVEGLTRVIEAQGQAVIATQAQSVSAFRAAAAEARAYLESVGAGSEQLARVDAALVAVEQRAAAAAQALRATADAIDATGKAADEAADHVTQAAAREIETEEEKAARLRATAEERRREIQAIDEANARSQAQLKPELDAARTEAQARARQEAERKAVTIERLTRLTEQHAQEVDTSSAKEVAAFRSSADAATQYLVKLGASDQQLDRIGASIAQVEQRVARGTTGFDALGRTGQRATITIAQGIEALARTGTSGIGSIQSGVASLTVLMGAGGPLVLAIGYAAAAIADLWIRAREEEKKAAQQAVDDIKKFADKVDELQNRRDIAGFERQREELIQGTPARNFTDSLERQRQEFARFKAFTNKEIEDLRSKAAAITVDGGEAQIRAAQSRINAINAEIKAKNDQLVAEEGKLRNREVQLATIEASIQRAKGRPTTATEEIEALGRVIALGKANNLELARAAELVRQLRAELAKLPAGPEGSARRAQILGDIQTLTQRPNRAAIRAATQEDSIENQVARFRNELNQLAAGQTGDTALDDIRARFAKLGQTLDELGDKARKNLADLKKSAADASTVRDAERTLTSLDELRTKLDATRDSAIALERVKLGERLQAALADLSTTAVDNLRLSLQALEKELTAAGASPEFVARVKQANADLLVTAGKSEALELRIKQLREDGVKPLTAVSELLRRRNEEETRLQQLQGKGIEFDREREQIGQNIAKIDAEIAQRTQENTQHLQGATVAASQLFGNMAQVGNVAFGIASAVLGVDSNLTKSVGSAAQLLDGIQNIRDAAQQAGSFANLFKTGAGLASALPGIGQIVGSGAALIASLSGLFGGESPERKAQREATERLTRALEDLNTHVGDLIGVTASGQQLETVRTIETTREVAIGRDDFTGQDITQTVDRSSRDIIADLRRAGVSLEELRQIAQQFGLTVSELPTPDEIRAIQEAIAQSDLAAYLDSFAGKIKQLEDSFRVSGETDPIKQLVDRVDLLKASSTSFAKALEGLDLSKAEDRAEGIKRLQALFANLPDALKGRGDLNVQQFIDELIGMIEKLRAVDGGALAPGEAFAAKLNALSVKFRAYGLSAADQLDALLALYQERFDSLKDLSAEDPAAVRAQLKSVVDAAIADGRIDENEQALIDALNAIIDAIASAAQEAADARNKFLEDADRDLEFTDVTGPLDRLQAKISAFAKAFPEFAEQLEGIDVRAPGGIAALDAVLQQLYESSKAGADALGLTEEEFKALIAALFGLESASDDAASAVESLADRLSTAFDEIDLEGRVFGKSAQETTGAKLGAFGLSGFDLSNKAGRDAVIATLQQAFTAATEESTRKLIASLIDSVRGLGDDVADAVSESDGGRAGSTDIRGSVATATVAQFDQFLGVATSQLVTQGRIEKLIQQLVANALRTPPVISAPTVTLASAAFVAHGAAASTLGAPTFAVTVHQQLVLGEVRGFDTRDELRAFLSEHGKDLADYINAALGKIAVEQAVNSGSNVLRR